MKFLLLFLLSLSPNGFATNVSPTEGSCGYTIQLFSRKIGQISPGKIRDAALTRNELIESLLILLHQEYQRYAAGQGGLSSGTFNPFWVFRNESAKKLLLENFPDGYRFVSNTGEIVERSFAEFLTEWENTFYRAGGRRSASWNGAERRDFIRRLILLLAVHHQKAFGIIAAGQPLDFTASPASDLSRLQGSAVLIQYFGSLDSFAREFRDFARNEIGARLPWFPAVRQVGLRDMSRQLQNFGISAPVVERPHRTADEWARLGTEILSQAFPLFYPSGRFPLAGVLTKIETAGYTNSRFGIAFQNVRLIKKVFGSYDQFVTQLYEKKRLSLPDLPPTSNSWEQEIAIQCAGLYVQENGGFKKFRSVWGFQITDRDALFYLDLNHDLIKMTGLDEIQLSSVLIDRFN